MARGLEARARHNSSNAHRTAVAADVGTKVSWFMQEGFLVLPGILLHFFWGHVWYGFSLYDCCGIG